MRSIRRGLPSAPPIGAPYPNRKWWRARNRRRPWAETWAASSASRCRFRCSIADIPKRRWPLRGPVGQKRSWRRCALGLRAEIAALRTAVLERRGAAERYRAAAVSSAELERIAEVSYAAGERGILELLDAYRSASIAQGRQTTLDVAARQVGDRAWICQWMGDSVMKALAVDHSAIGCFGCCARKASGAASGGSVARRDELDGEDRAVHGVSAARGRSDGTVRGAPDEARRLQRAERRAAQHRDDAGSRWRRSHARRLGPAAARRFPRRRDNPAGRAGIGGC